jgi:hypothetical protein
MWFVVALWALLFSSQGTPAAAPDEKAVQASLDQLDEALRSQDAKRIQAALEGAQALPHPALVKKIERGLDDERLEVRLATIQALRWQTHADALTVLHRIFRQRRFVKDAQISASLLRAIGQHADPSSIPLLAQEPFEPNDRFCVQARLFGLARLRTPEALEGVFTILGATTSNGERRIKLWMEDARVALMFLTGVDRGNAPELWEEWWRKNRRAFQIASEPPKLPKELRESWERFWGLPMGGERERRREDRGSPPSK